MNSNIDFKQQVAIVGLGFRLPGDSNTPKQFWDNLINKFDGIVDATCCDYNRWSENHVNSSDINSKNAGLVSIDEWKKFDPLLFGISPSDCISIDPQQRLLLKATYEAFEDANIDIFKIRGSSCSVMIGCTMSDYQKAQTDRVTGQFLNCFASNLHTISNRISYCFDLRGQSITMDTACSSSTNALNLGYKTILDGESTMSVVGGSNFLLDTFFTESMSYLSMLGKSGLCKTFDSEADGFVRSEGVGVVVLKRLDLAIRDGNQIYCLVSGTSSNTDGMFNKSNLLQPSKYAQCENIKNALKKGKVNSNDIDYFECHGTGTPVGDPIEVESISMALNERSKTLSPLLLGSVKSNIGHLECASGIASVIKCCLMMKHRTFAPNIHFNSPNPAIKFNEWNLKVVTDAIPFPNNKKVIMGINNFGVTGSNTCIFLKEFNNNNNYQNNNNQNNNNQNNSNSNYLIPFSSNSKNSLKSYQSEIFHNIDQLSNDINFKDFALHQVYCKTLNYQQRSVLISNSWNNLVKSYENQIITSNNKTFNILHKHQNPEIIFVMCGQGSQYSTMANQLYDNNMVFRNSMDKVNGILSKYTQFNVLEKLRSIDVNDKIANHDPLIAQCSLFMVQASLIELYKSWGINPSMVVGHSFGEITALYCSGMLSLEDVCFCVYQRSKLQSLTTTTQTDKSKNNRMLVININETQFKDSYSSKYPTIEICCYNSLSSIVIGGREDLLIEISNHSKENGIFSAFLGSLSSFHTSSQDIIKEEVLESLKPLSFSQPNIPIFSTTTGELLDYQELSPAEYTFANIRKPVLFTKSIKNIFNYIENQNQNNKIVFVEISPHPTLSFYLKQIIQNINSTYFNNSDDSISVLTSLNKNKTDLNEIQNTIAQLYCKGYNVNFKSQFENQEDINISELMTKTSDIAKYQWDDGDYWLENELALNVRNNGPSVDQIGNLITLSDTKVYDSFIDVSKPPFEYLKGHLVKDKCFCPGSAYISTIIDLLKDKESINISYLEFGTPLIFKNKEIKHLQTSYFKTSKNEYKFKFQFKDKDHQWVETSNGKVQEFIYKNTVPTDKVNIEELKLKCNLSKLSKDEVYTQIKARTGLAYSNHFQRVEECYHGDGCTLSKLSLTPHITNFKKSFFDPSILDSCLHGLVSYLDIPSQLVFDRVEDYKVYNSNVPKDLSKYSHLYIYSDYLSTIGDSFYASLLVMLPDGTILIDSDKFVSTSLVPIKDPLTIQYPTKELHSFYFQERDSIIKNNLNLNQLLNNNANIIPKIIENSIKPSVNERAVFRILQFVIGDQDQDETIQLKPTIETINSILANNKSSEIDIEYTIGLESDQQINKFKSSTVVSQIDPSISLLLKKLNLNESSESLLLQSLKTNYFDIVILPNQISSNSKLLNQLELFKILNPCGLLIHFTEYNININNEDLIEIGFNNNYFINENNQQQQEEQKILIVSQKPSILDITPQIPNYDQIIIFTGSNLTNQINQFISIINNSYNNNRNNIKVISSQDQFELISSNVTNNSLIYFISTINQINNNDELINCMMDYVKINQFLLKNNLTTKHIMVSCYSQKETLYYKNSTLIGARKYFEEFPSLLLYSIDFDNESLFGSGINNLQTIELIEKLTSTNQHAEYIIRNGIPYFERIKKESNLSKLKSTSFVSIDDNNSDQLYAKLNINLEYKLQVKPTELDPDYVEVKTMAIGINYKDYLIYRGLLPLELINSKGDIHDPELCTDFSGIITKVGSNVSSFKIGDSVLGYSFNTSSSHIKVHKDRIILKPNQLSFVEASTIPCSYITSLYCIFKIGNFSIEDNESILIHSAGGLGLSAIEILKWKGFKSHLFVTVGSKEKEQYLKETYGDFITGIYRNYNYVKEIKKKLRKLGSNKDGVDLILNTLSNEFIESNFKCLSSEGGGRVIDCTNTHLNAQEYTDFNKFKNNVSYLNVETIKLPSKTINKLLKELINGFTNEGLNLLPIKEYSVNEIKKAIDYISERKLIGKISINIDNDILSPLIKSQSSLNSYQFLKPNYKINYNSLGKTVLVTGQGGLVLEIIKWISRFSTSVENIIILSKSSLKWELQKLINKNKLGKYNNKINYIFKSGDIGNYESTRMIIDEIYDNTNIAPIESIFHYAFQYVNHDPLEIDSKSLIQSFSAKVFGAINLHNLSLEKQWKLKQFVLASSIAGVFGSTIQCGYTSGNCLLDGLANHRKSLGLPAISVNWGLFQTHGMISVKNSIGKLVEGIGFSEISNNLFLGSLDLFLQNQNESTRFMVSAFNESINGYSNRPIGNKIDFFSNSMQSKNTLISNQESNNSDLILQKISDLLLIEPTKINIDLGLQSYGSDSMVVLSLKNWIDQTFSTSLTSSQLLSLTISSIIQNIINK